MTLPSLPWALAGIASAVALVQTSRLHALQAGVAADQATAAETALLRERGARADQQRLDAAARKVTDAYLTRAAARRDDAAGVDAAYRELLDAIAAAGGAADDPAAACRADAGRIRELERLLGEAAGLAAEGGRHVARLDAKLAGLQQHVAEVRLVPVGSAASAAAP